jgi:hypothetical protein
MITCKQCERLRGAVQAALARLAELTTAQLNAFRSNDERAFMRVDKELENAMGAKERVIGAMRQHRKEHGEAA